MDEVLNYLLMEDLRIFSILAASILILLVLEMVLAVMGLSSDIGGDSDADFDADSEVDVDMAPAGGLSAAMIGFSPEIDQLEPHELAFIEFPEEKKQLFPRRPGPVRRFFGRIGLGNGPLMVGLASIAMTVSSLGFFLQITLDSLFGAMLPGAIALLVVLVPALLAAGKFTKFLARLIPSVESYSVSGETYNGRAGYVVIGASRRGSPAQVRYKDMFGNTHEVMAEPLRDTDIIESGTEVLILKTRERKPRLLPRLS